jgi:hypothetical protein
MYNVVILLCIVFFGCASTKNGTTEARRLVTNQKTERSIGTNGSVASTTTDNFVLDAHLEILIKPKGLATLVSDHNNALTQTVKNQEDGELSPQDFAFNAYAILEYFEPKSPVANKIVDNYMNSRNKEPGGHCLNVSKTRFEKAYRDVYGHSVYVDLPDSMATPYYTPKEAFDFIYVSASGNHERWHSLPMSYRGKGSAGAIAYAGMGTLMNGEEIWGGKLKPGAPMQVWRHRKDYEEVARGVSTKDYYAFGHSFIFMGYIRNENNDIIGIRIADQGYQSHRALKTYDYEVWWAVNLSI